MQNDDGGYQIVIHDGRSVAALIEQLQQLDPKQRFLVQAILPDGTTCNAPAVIAEVPQSNCGDGLKYLALQIRCDQEAASVSQRR